MRDSGALNESELEAVAGGFNPQPEPPTMTLMTQTMLRLTKSLIVSRGP